MPVFPTPPLDESITPGQLGHIADHDAIHLALNRFKGNEVYNVIGYGAVGNGAADDTTAIQDAIDACIAAGGGTVFLPEGIYKVTSTLVIADIAGLRLVGASCRASVIRPTTAVGANPVVQFVDHRDCSVENLMIEGDGSNTTACINSHRDAAIPTYNSHHLTVRDVRLGANSSNNMDFGIQTTCDGGSDTNNDYHCYDNVEIANAAIAAYSFEHYNSLGHDIINPTITQCPIAFRNTSAGGGQFQLHGGSIGVVSDVLLELNGTIDSNHAWVLHGFNAEGVNRLLRATAAGGVHVLMGHFSFYGTTTPVDVVDFDGGATSYLEIDNAFILTGQPATTLQFSNTAGKVRITNNVLGITDIVFNGDLHWAGNVPRSSQTFTAGASSTLHAGGDSSGPYKFGQFSRSTAIADFAIGAGISAEANDRYTMNHRGDMKWGAGGASATDTEVRRGGVGFLAVPMCVVAGVPSDGSFLSAPPNGTLAINSSTDVMYYRKAGVWTAIV